MEKIRLSICTGPAAARGPTQVRYTRGYTETMYHAGPCSVIVTYRYPTRCYSKQIAIL